MLLASLKMLYKLPNEIQDQYIHILEKIYRDDISPTIPTLHSKAGVLIQK